MPEEGAIKFSFNLSTTNNSKSTSAPQNALSKRQFEGPKLFNASKRQKMSVGQHFRSSSHVATRKKLGQVSISANESKIRPYVDDAEKKNKVAKKDVKFAPDPKIHEYNDSGGTFKRQSTLPLTRNVKQHSVSKFSSLWRKNPEIPQIPKSEKVPLTESVFSAQSFDDVDLDPHLRSNVKKLGYETMTTVQQLAIPLLLEGKDALIKSQTGSGKTLTYALPIIHQLMQRETKVQRKDGTYAIIIVPTRELAIQSYQCLEKLCKSCVWVVPGYLIGGEKKKAEKGRLRKGISILVATPGRLIDHIDTTNSLSLQKVEYLIIDEADRMLEMGYENSVMRIVHSLNEQKESEETKRQTIMLSATLTTAVEKLAGLSLNSPEIIDATLSNNSEGISLDSELLTTPENLTQYYTIVPAKVRLVTLASFILAKCNVESERKMLIFMTTQDMVDFHTSIFSYVLSRFGEVQQSSLEKRASKVLSGGSDDHEEDSDMEDDEEEKKGLFNPKDSISFLKLHGSMTQFERTAVFKSFSEADTGVLLCTDVAARGLDLPKVNWIVQYTAACTAADYVHRVGRTARANTKGSALVFLSPAEAPYVSMLESYSIILQQMQMNHVLLRLLHSSIRKTLGFCRNEEAAATQLQIIFENRIEGDKDLHSMATAAFLSFTRAYAALPKRSREIFAFHALHLGHYAKSFGLKDRPGVLGASLAPQHSKGGFRNKQKQYPKKGMSSRQSKSSVSEFDSGFDGIDASSKKNKKKGGASVSAIRRSVKPFGKSIKR